MSIFDKIHRESQGPTSEPQDLTARKFLGLDGNNGYCTVDECLAYAKSLSRSEINNLENVINWMAEGHPIDDQSKTREDKVKRVYSYPRFRISSKSTPGGKVVLEAGMKQLLNDYAKGLINVCFTLEELIEEALNG